MSPSTRCTPEVRFASASGRAAFAEEPANAATALVSTYHDETAPGGRSHRVVAALHPGARTDDPARADTPQEQTT